MAGLVPAIHALLRSKKDVDARHKAGHDKSQGETPVSKLDETRELVARANRMIANEGVLDAFGHVTCGIRPIRGAS